MMKAIVGRQAQNFSGSMLRPAFTKVLKGFDAG
jgi:hypothetical protein